MDEDYNEYGIEYPGGFVEYFETEESFSRELNTIIGGDFTVKVVAKVTKV
jgi:hypothetical protein